MEEILLRLEVPSIQEHFDIFAPADLQIGQLTEVVANGVQDMSNGRYSASGQELLMLRYPDALLNPGRSLKEYNIHDGACLMLL